MKNRLRLECAPEVFKGQKVLFFVQKKKKINLEMFDVINHFKDNLNV